MTEAPVVHVVKAWLSLVVNPVCILHPALFRPPPQRGGKSRLSQNVLLQSLVTGGGRVSATRQGTAALHVAKWDADAIYRRKPVPCFVTPARVCRVRHGLLSVIEQLGRLGSQIIRSTLGCFDHGVTNVCGGCSKVA